MLGPLYLFLDQPDSSFEAFDQVILCCIIAVISECFLLDFDCCQLKVVGAYRRRNGTALQTQLGAVEAYRLVIRVSTRFFCICGSE